MRILSYSPSVSVYAAASGKGGAVTYYDLTRDVERVYVSLKENGVSECTVKVQNKNSKYNNTFLPMDRITVFATKRGHENQIFTGYISSMPRYQMYPASFELKCYCSLYRLQNLWWDKELLASTLALGYGNSRGTWESVLANLLIDVADMPPENILIGSMPDDVISWARELYAAQKVDIDDMASKVDAFYQMLASTNGVITGTYGDMSASGLSEPLSAGQTLTIPSSVPQTGLIGDYTGYNTFYGVWANGTNQKAVSELWAANGKTFRKNIAVIGKYYLVAVRGQFGSAGDYVDIKIQDGTVIPAIIADIKGSDAMEWGHEYGGKFSLIEWEVNQGVFGNSDLGDWYGQAVISITNRGSCL